MKRILSIMVAICMMVAMLPVVATSVKAEETAIKWTSTDSLPTDSGSYYLENSVDLTSAWVVDGKNITIDMHGRSIESTASIMSLENGASVTFTNSVEGYGSIDGFGTKISTIDETSTLNLKDVRLQPTIDSSGCGIYNEGTLNTENIFVYAIGIGDNPGITIYNTGTWNSVKDRIMHIHANVGSITLRNQGEATLTDTYMEASGTGDTQSYGIYQTGAKSVYLVGNVNIKADWASIKATNANSIYATSKDGSKAFTGEPLTVDCNDKYAPYNQPVVINVTDDTKDKFKLVAPESAGFSYKDAKLYLVAKSPETTVPETTVPTTTEQTTVAPTIKPVAPKTSIKKIKAKKRALKVTWKTKKNIDGYQLQYGKKKSFKGAKTKTIKKIKTKSYTIKKLGKKKKYYVRIRTFINNTPKKIFSAWSKAKIKNTK